MRIFRIQDKDGRGPWKPGFSHRWLDADGPPLPPAITATLRDFHGIAAKAHAKGMHIGCAVWEGKLSEWVTGAEWERLKGFGYFVANAGQCQVLADDGMQLLVASKKPFRRLPRVTSGDWGAR